jgi:peroxiredoxin
MRTTAVAVAAVSILAAGAWLLAGSVPAAAEGGATEKPAAPAEGEKKPAEEKKAPEGAAPEFTLKDTNGKEHSLKEYRGKVVVLEWINHGCPYVKKHYGADNMQKLQRKYVEKGVVWLSICSSAEGKEGFMAPAEWNEKVKALKAAPTAVLLDADGKVGHLYAAKCTPHMFVIGKDGVVAYRGAIDDKPSPNPTTIEGAKNYVADACDALLADKMPEVRDTKPYG